MQTREKTRSLPRLQELRFLYPHEGIEEDYNNIYNQNQVEVGWPKGAQRVFSELTRANTASIVGVALGDEGKGRIVDNKIQCLLDMPGVKTVYVVRFNGGNNSGHTLEKADGTKLALNAIPSAVLYPQAVGIIDRGMTIHPEDLRTESEYVERKTGENINGRLFLSEEALLNTDLDRAEETLNKIRNGGKSGGGTGRGIAPSFAHSYDRLGLKIGDLMTDDWKEKLEKLYDDRRKLCNAYGLDLADMEVPDYRAEKLEGKRGEEAKRKVGSKKEFIDRIADARNWLVEKNMVTNTYILHEETYQDMKRGILFEGAQAIGLHPWLGTRPDVTSSDPSNNGIRTGTAFWTPENIAEKIGVFKLTYTSSVGAREFPEMILPKKFDLNNPGRELTKDEEWAVKVTNVANEFGTTSGRRRDILRLNLAMMAYNCRMAGVDSLAGTHLDIAWENEPIKICTHYTDKNGKYLPYQPGLEYQKGAVPHYIELPGWDGEACRKARNVEELPENAVKFMAFIQARIGYPIVAATTGPAREHFMTFNGYNH